MTRVEVNLPDPQARNLWRAVGELVDRLPGEWALIGGLMVQLHALERDMTDVRLTRDIDVLAQARPPGALCAIDDALRADGFEGARPDPDGFAHRYERDGLIVDLLAPDGLSKAPSLGGGLKAVGVPGGSQALARAHVVGVRVDDVDFEIRRPNLLGAILLKARSIRRHADPDSQRDDLIRLLGLVDDPRTLAADLTRSEQSWLRKADERLDFDRPTVVGDAVVRNARLTYRILIRDS